MRRSRIEVWTLSKRLKDQAVKKVNQVPVKSYAVASVLVGNSRVHFEKSHKRRIKAEIKKKQVKI